MSLETTDIQGIAKALAENKKILDDGEKELARLHRDYETAKNDYLSKMNNARSEIGKLSHQLTRAVTDFASVTRTTLPKLPPGATLDSLPAERTGQRAKNPDLVDRSVIAQRSESRLGPVLDTIKLGGSGANTWGHQIRREVVIFFRAAPRTVADFVEFMRPIGYSEKSLSTSMFGAYRSYLLKHGWTRELVNVPGRTRAVVRLIPPSGDVKIADLEAATPAEKGRFLADLETEREATKS